MVTIERKLIGTRDGEPLGEHGSVERERERGARLRDRPGTRQTRSFDPG
jgi:hypothetical protein